MIFLTLLSILSFISAENTKENNVLPISKLTIPEKTDLIINNLNISNLEEDEKIKIIIHLKDPENLWGKEINSFNSLEIKNLKTEIRENVISKINKQNVKHRFSSFNGFSTEVTLDELEELLKNPLILNIEEDYEVFSLLQDSVSIINVDNIWNYKINDLNITGHNQTVCIVDTGVDYTHQDLGGCESIYSTDFLEEDLDSNITSPNYPNNYPNDYNSLIEIITIEGADSVSIFFEELILEYDYDYVLLYDKNDNLITYFTDEINNFWSPVILGDTIKIWFYSDSSVTEKGFNITKVRSYQTTLACEKVIGGYDFINFDNDPFDDRFHGTHVAGITSGNGLIKGVSPDSKIFAVKSLNYLGSGTVSGIVAGIEYCTANAQDNNISVINLSLGSSTKYTNYCDASNLSYSYAINDAIDNNISVVIATGNSYNLDRISSPACIENAIRVGSSLKADNNLSDFSDRWALDMILAPGSNIYSTIPNNLYSSLNGTSMATPHVAGAILLINQYFKLNNISITPSEINQLFKDTAKTITQNSIDFKRIDVLEFFNEFFNFNFNIISPENNFIYNDSNILLNIEKEDSVSSIKYSFTYDGIKEDYLEPVYFDLVDDNYTLHIWSYNQYLEEIYKDVNFLIDTIPPDINLGENIIAGEIFTKSAEVIEEGSGISSILWSLVSGPLDGNVYFSSLNTLETDINADKDGNYTIRLSVEDFATNLGQKDFNFLWDTPPRFLDYNISQDNEIIYLFFSEPIFSNIDLTGDINLSDLNIFFSDENIINDINLTHVAGNDFLILNLDFNQVSDGSHEIIINPLENSIYDDRESVMSPLDSLIIFLNDRVPPQGYSVSINNAIIEYSSRTQFSFTIFDAEIDADYNYTIISNNGTGKVTNTGKITQTQQNFSNINVSSLANGILTLSLFLKDVSGNKGIFVIDVVEKNVIVPSSPPSGGSSPPGSLPPIFPSSSSPPATQTNVEVIEDNITLEDKEKILDSFTSFSLIENIDIEQITIILEEKEEKDIFEQKYLEIFENVDEDKKEYLENLLKEKNSGKINISSNLKVYNLIDKDQNKYISNIITTLEVKEDLDILTFIEEISKEIAQDISEINFDLINPTEILNRDPIVLFTFNDLKKGETIEISYFVDKKIDSLENNKYFEASLNFQEEDINISSQTEEVLEVIETKKDNNLFWYLLLIILIIFIPIGIYIFIKNKHHTLDKKD